MIIPPTISKDVLKSMVRFRIKVSHSPSNQREVNNLFSIYTGLLNELNLKATVNTFELVRFKFGCDTEQKRYDQLADVVVNVNGPPRHANRASYAKTYRPGTKAVQTRMDMVSEALRSVYAVLLPYKFTQELPTYQPSELVRYLSTPTPDRPYWRFTASPPEELVASTGLHLGDIQKVDVVSEERGIEVLGDELQGYESLDDILAGFRGFV